MGKKKDVAAQTAVREKLFMDYPDDDKLCTRCGETKKVQDFKIIYGKYPRIHSWCLDCFRKYNRERYEGYSGPR